jgi:broad specificity phosphatase PhoE
VATILLVRHGAFDGLGEELSGRPPGAGLNALGRTQSQRLAAWASAQRIAGLYSSPLRRTRETASILGDALGLPVQVEDRLKEVEFGRWNDQRITALAGDAAWEAFNGQRSVTRIPGGELMIGVQARAVECLLDLASHHGGQTVLAVSHADVIRAVVAAILGCGLDLLSRLTVDPASVTAITLGDGPPRLLGLNHSPPSASPEPLDPAPS